jgi:DNA-binding transcriptional MerR regulator
MPSLQTPAPTFDDVWRTIQELALLSKQTERSLKETERLMKERSAETERQFQETDRKFQATERLMKEQSDETERTLKELGKQIGGVSKKFGSFTEGLALPSMERILRERFGMEVISPSVRLHKGGDEMQIDVLAYANGAINQAYVVEVKSHVREDSITQLTKMLGRFRYFFPEHKDKAVFGILAAVDISGLLRRCALKEGLYVARIHEEVFEMDTPEDFQARAW